MRVEAFPWSEVPSALGVEGKLARARRAAARRFDLQGLAPLLSRVFAIELSGFGVSGVRVERELVLDPWSVEIHYPEFSLVSRCQPELVALLLTRLLERPFRLTDPNAPVAPAIAGAWHAIVLEITRVLARGEPPRLEVAPKKQSHGAVTVLQTWVRVEQRSYALELALLPGPADTPEYDGDVPVTLELVAATATLLAGELAEVRVGDVIVPEAPGISREGAGSVVAISSAEERGFRLQLSDVVRYVGLESLSHEMPMESSSDDATKESVITTTPVVIRVEVGSITLSAREWMSLKPGDVLSCGVPPRGPVVLRAAGRELARGELVTVDGQVGVRIHELSVGNDDATTPGPTSHAREGR